MGFLASLSCSWIQRLTTPDSGLTSNKNKHFKKMAHISLLVPSELFPALAVCRALHCILLSAASHGDAPVFTRTLLWALIAPWANQFFWEKWLKLSLLQAEASLSWKFPVQPTGWHPTYKASWNGGTASLPPLKYTTLFHFPNTTFNHIEGGKCL